MRSDKDDAQKAVEAMLILRKQIDHSVSHSPLAFLADPLAKVLGKSHEALKGFITPKGILAPANIRARPNGAYAAHAGLARRKARGRTLAMADSMNVVSG